MKQWEAKVFVPTNSIEAELNKLGKDGWQFAALVKISNGFKCIMKRETDRDVEPSSVGFNGRIL